MTRVVLLMCCVAVSACNPLAAGRAPSIAVADSAVQPGLASCLATIGRADVAVDPDAPMSNAEIEALLGCTADRASR